MGIWNLKKVALAIEELHISDKRESENIAGWIWEETMGFSCNTELNLSDHDERTIVNLIQRVAFGEPVQYLAGHAWFYGLKLKVTPDVLIPRPETEELVSWIIEDILKDHKTSIRILDIGTGSGCISVALKKELKGKATIFAIDISQAALEVAIHNASTIDQDITFIRKDFLNEDLCDLGTFDLIVSNPPYISKDFLANDIISQIRFEPSIALYAEGDDPDIFYRKIADTGKGLLNENGICYLELNEYRSEVIASYFDMSSWHEMEIRKDLQGSKRMLRASGKKVNT
ncbi:MAG: peptide chain release factor N(5)-glutamine methyltransferase [Saprospiraceae bacterium]